jgi:hypothetical protein
LDFRRLRQAPAAKAQFAFGGKLADAQGQIVGAEAAREEVLSLVSSRRTPDLGWGDPVLVPPSDHFGFFAQDITTGSGEAPLNGSSQGIGWMALVSPERAPA